MSEDDFTAKELIAELRGGIPPMCDFSGGITPPEKMHPEEVGCWVCEECLDRWEKAEAGR